MNKENSNKNLGTVLVTFTAVFAVIGMILEACAILFGYDPAMQVFKLESKVATVSVAALFVLSAMTAALAIYSAKREKLSTAAPESLLADILSPFGGCAVVISSVLIYIENMKNAGPLNTFALLLAALSLPAGLYFILGTRKNDMRTSALAFFPPIWASICLLRLYFDVGTAINDPVRILFQISLVVIMLALLFELKMRIKESGRTAFAVTASLSVILSGASAVSVFLLYFITKSVSAGQFFLSLCSLILSLYLLIKLQGYMKRS